MVANSRGERLVLVEMRSLVVAKFYTSPDSHDNIRHLQCIID